MRYASDGTIAGTIERHAHFSWTEFEMVSGVYRRVAFNPAEELSAAEHAALDAVINGLKAGLDRIGIKMATAGVQPAEAEEEPEPAPGGQSLT